MDSFGGPAAEMLKKDRHVGTWSGFWSGEAILLLCNAVDAADRAMLPSSFAALQLDLRASPSALGTLTLLQSCAFALSLPIWGCLVVLFSQRDLLALGCLIWGGATFLLACSSQYLTHCALRVVNGIGLAAVVPISQVLLVGMVPKDRRGEAFGRLQGCASLAGMVAAAYAVGQQRAEFEVWGAEVRGWRVVHLQISLASMALACLVYRKLQVSAASSGRGDARGSEVAAAAASLSEHWLHPAKSSLDGACRLLQVPSFVLLVLQGVIGAVPWHASSFVSLYFSNCGFTDRQLAVLTGSQGVGACLGTLLGGALGDAAARRYPQWGRPFVAMLSVCLGIPFYLTLFLVVPRDPAYLFAVAVVAFLFAVLGSWTPAAAIRPICVELVHSPAERAQALALQLMLECSLSSVFGGPLVGLLSEHFGYQAGAADGRASAAALGRALSGVGAASYIPCALLWAAICHTLPRDLRETGHGQHGHKLGDDAKVPLAKQEGTKAGAYS